MPPRHEIHGTSGMYKKGCRCEKCADYRRNYDRARYLRIREKKAAQTKVWRAANREKVRGYSAAQYHRDPEKAKAAARASAARNPEAAKAGQRRYSQSDHGRAMAAAKAALRRGARSDEWSHDYTLILYADLCSFCGGPGGTVDHIVAIAKGGTNEWHNLTSACAYCNSSKADLDLLQFLLRVRQREAAA